ncbi:MAG: FtsW/RodA/SpoVE family cell cycle protein [Bacteroidales bacterium]
MKKLDNNKTSKPKRKQFIHLKGDKLIWVIVALFAMISIMSVYSSSNSLAYKAHTSTLAFLFKQSRYVFIGLLIILICYKIPLGYYRMLAIPLLILTMGLLMYTTISGLVINSAHRWIKIVGITFQPSELAKVSTILYLATTMEKYNIKTYKDFFLRIVFPLGIVLLLCLVGSASATIIIAIICFLILVLGGLEKRFIKMIIYIALGGMILVYGIHTFTGAFSRIDTFEGRIERFFSGKEEEMTEEQQEEYNKKNFQSEQAREAIQLGGIIGRGPGNSIKRDSLPHPYSDYIFTTIIEEWGLLGAIGVMLLYLWFFYRSTMIAKNCKKIFSMLTIIGLSTLILIQAFIHILVNVGLIPVTGQTLPLISLGGSSMMIMSMAVGIILAINRTIDIKIEKDQIEQSEKEKAAAEVWKKELDEGKIDNKLYEEENNN